MTLDQTAWAGLASWDGRAPIQYASDHGVIHTTTEGTLTFAMQLLADACSSAQPIMVGELRDESCPIGSIETYKMAENLRNGRHVGAIIPIVTIKEIKTLLNS